MSLLLKLIRENRPLHTWEDHTPLEKPEPPASRFSTDFDWARGRDVANIARTIVSGLTHEAVVRLVAKEWDSLPPGLRMKVTALANESYQSPSSHNLAKSIQKLDAKLKGKILSKAQGPTERNLKVIDGKLRSLNRQVRQNVAGAERAFAAFTTPKDFNTWDPARKRRFREQMAKERRQQGKK
jgi:hypothetical protein